MNATSPTPKSARGRTEASDTPIAIRSRVALPTAASQRMRERLRRRFGHAATLVERATIRFEDVNGPRGGDDTVCRIKLVLSGRPSVQVEQRGADPGRAFAEALARVGTALERTRDKHGLSSGRRSARGGSARSPAGRDRDAGSLIGRRVGRGPQAVARALDRPEKRRGDADVDTAMPGVSASDRKAGGGHTARRNAHAKGHDRATVTLEDSRTRPSRKSTRRSANRGKASQGKERTAVAASVQPSARAARANARR